MELATIVQLECQNCGEPSTDTKIGKIARFGKKNPRKKGAGAFSE
jgi:hypothetical protein